MKYTLICFTFNKVNQLKNDVISNADRLQLRNNWSEECKDENHLFQVLEAFGFKPPFYFPNVNKVVKMSGDFTIENTRIICHIITNN